MYEQAMRRSVPDESIAIRSKDCSTAAEVQRVRSGPKANKLLMIRSHATMSAYASDLPNRPPSRIQCYCYLQNGQLPLPPSLVAAAAVVANSAKAAAVSANSFDFMIIPFGVVAVHPLQFYDKR